MANKFYKTSGFLTKYGNRDSWADYARANVNGRHDLTVSDERGCAFLLLDPNWDNEQISTVRTYRLYINAPTEGYSMINSDVSNINPFPMVDTTISGTNTINTTRPIGQWSAIYSFTYDKYRTALSAWAYAKTGRDLPNDLGGAVWIDTSQLPYYLSNDPDLYEKVKKYVDNGDFSDAENADILDERLYAIWYVGYAGGSKNSVYTIASDIPQFADGGSKFYGKGTVTRIHLKQGYKWDNGDYTPAGESALSYGQTFSTDIQSVIESSYGVFGNADKIALKLADLTNVTTLRLEFWADYTDSDGSTVETPHGFVDFDHVTVDDYGFITSPTQDQIIFEAGKVLSDDNSNPSNAEIDDEVSDEIEDNDGITEDGSNIGNYTYALNRSEAQGLMVNLWNSTFIDNIKLINNTPIENIVSLKVFPFDIPCDSTDTSIIVGNVSLSPATGRLLTDGTYKKRNGIALWNSLIKDGFSGNLKYLNYSPYTTVELYLPFVGLRELPVDTLMHFAEDSGNLIITYYIDLITGDATVVVHLQNDNLIESTDTAPLLLEHCNVAIDVPISAQNQNQVLATYAQNALSAGFSIGNGLMTGNVAGAVSGTVNAGVNSVLTQYHTTNKGTPQPRTALRLAMCPYLRITRPKVWSVGDIGSNKRRKYLELKGGVLNEITNIGSLRGFIKVQNPTIAVDGATKSEQDEINRLLAEGVFYNPSKSN